MLRFASPPPRVRLTKAFPTPFRNVVATARTCYSAKGIVDDAQVGAPEKFGPLAQSIYEAGHHTTYQHAHFQFALEGVSRQFLWSFLHAHPFYNSEQVSQRYVAVKPDNAVVPELPAPADAIYRGMLGFLHDAYQRLCAMLEGPAESEFYRRFHRSGRMAAEHRKTIRKRAQEAARYVLPLATTAYLYHTVSGITLLRYWRMARTEDTPSEQLAVVGAMVEALLAHDPDYRIVLEEPLAAESMPEAAFFAARPGEPAGAHADAFAAEFDASLGGRTAALVGWQENAPALVASAVREVLGLPQAALADEEAVRLALDPARNALLGQALNLTTHSKLGRALAHAHYTFRKRLSHAADSQDQRHRMTPGSRPVLAAHLRSAPDVIRPALVERDDAARAFFDEAMARLWEGIGRLRALGTPMEAIQYLLPNAVVVRFTESADLLNLRHKHTMRLCWNAQEEIWRASIDEAAAVRAVHPLLGSFLQPPCTQRAAAKARPICPEGARFCGVRVWKLDPAAWERVI